MRRLRPVVVACVLSLCAPAYAQVQTVDRAFKGDAGKDIRIGVFINVSKDCTSGPLPAVRLSTTPQHGKVTVRQGKVKATNYKECLALEVPGFVAFYRSQADFKGVDELILEIKFPNGRTEIQRIRVTVGGGGPNREI